MDIEKYAFLLLSSISLASFLWDMANSAKPDDATKCAVWLGSPMFPTEVSFQIWTKMKNTTQQP